MINSVLSDNMGLTVLLALLTVAYAGRAPYLGGDIQDILEETKAKIVRPEMDKHVTEKQRRDSTNYNSKFTDIAKAYAEGYKAAIKAVQARAYIAKQRLLSSKYGSKSAKSSIPYTNFRSKPVLQNALPLVPKSMIAVNNKSPNPANRLVNNQFNPSNQRVSKSTIPTNPYNTFANVGPQYNSVSNPSMVNDHANSRIVSKSDIPVPQQAIRYLMHQKSESFNPIENSYFMKTPSSSSPISTAMIPSPSSSDVPHNIMARSVPIFDFKQPYHPAFSSVPLTRRSKIEMNRIAKLNSRARHRNVYFDGTGGNPFNGGGILSHQNAISLKKHRRRRRRSIKEIEYSSDKMSLARHRRSHMPYLGQNLDKLGVVRAIPRTWTSQKKSVEAQIPEQDAAYAAMPSYPQYMGSPARFTQYIPGSFRGNIPQPMAMSAQGNYRQMYHYPLLQQYSGFRSMIPSYPAFYNQMSTPFGYNYPAPVPQGIISESSPDVENEEPNIIDV